MMLVGLALMSYISLMNKLLLIKGVHQILEITFIYMMMWGKIFTVDVDLVLLERLREEVICWPWSCRHQAMIYGFINFTFFTGPRTFTKDRVARNSGTCLSWPFTWRFRELNRVDCWCQSSWSLDWIFNWLMRCSNVPGILNACQFFLRNITKLVYVHLVGKLFLSWKIGWRRCTAFWTFKIATSILQHHSLLAISRKRQLLVQQVADTRSYLAI